jgi:hypothetical protein
MKADARGVIGGVVGIVVALVFVRFFGVLLRGALFAPKVALVVLVLAFAWWRLKRLWRNR